MIDDSGEPTSGARPAGRRQCRRRGVQDVAGSAPGRAGCDAPRLASPQNQVSRSSSRSRQYAHDTTQGIDERAGVYGVGCGRHAERQSIVAQTIEQFLKPAAVGRYVDEIEDIWKWRGWRRIGGPASDASNAMSAIDGALWDIMESVPACRSTTCGRQARHASRCLPT